MMAAMKNIHEYMADWKYNLNFSRCRTVTDFDNYGKVRNSHVWQYLKSKDLDNGMSIDTHSCRYCIGWAMKDLIGRNGQLLAVKIKTPDTEKPYEYRMKKVDGYNTMLPHKGEQ